MSVTDLHPTYDPEHERRLVERQAAHDAATDWSLVPEHDRPPMVADRAIDQWAQGRIAETGQVYETARTDLAGAIATSLVEGERREHEAATARADEVRASRQRDRLAAVLRGERRGDDEGDWSDGGRMSERMWLAALLSALVYVAAAGVDAGLNYLAFRIMGVSSLETVVLAAGVVLVTVLLPKQLGEMLESRRRGARRGPRRTTLMIAAGTLWLGVSAFVAVIRTSYLMLPGGAGTAAQRPSLPALAGVSPALLTAGWLAVALAVGLVVLVHAMRRHNPYVRSWRLAERTATSAGRRTADLKWESDRAGQRVRQARDGLDALERDRERAVASCRSFAEELKESYRASYRRCRGAPEHLPPDRPAIDAPQERS